MLRIILSASLAAALCAPAGAAGAEEQSWLRRMFVDPEDNHLDMSALLARGGFIPMPIIITEPAVDNGLGLAGYFIRNPEPGRKTPTRTLIGFGKTGNGSYGGGFMRSGALGDDRILYNFGFAKGLAVMDFYPGNRDYYLTYNNDITYAVARARYRFGDTNFSLGPALRYRENDIALDAGDRFPELAPFAGQDIALPSIALEAHYDDRDNPITPSRGLNVVANLQSFNQAIGSDMTFTSASVFGAWFVPRGPWGLGLMGQGEVTSEDTPFFMKPDIDLRGVARGRYQGDELVMGEIELRRQVTPRWAALGFVGHGRTFDDASEVTSYGVGLRYRIARLFGLDVGLDYAWGPDQNVVYVQFGHAWGRQMD